MPERSTPDPLFAVASDVVVAVSIVLLIGFSRIFLGVHYLTDVVAGVSVGSLWLLIGSASLSAGQPGGPQARRQPSVMDGETPR